MNKYLSCLIISSSVALCSQAAEKSAAELLAEIARTEEEIARSKAKTAIYEAQIAAYEADPPFFLDANKCMIQVEKGPNGTYSGSRDGLVLTPEEAKSLYLSRVKKS